MLHLIPYATRSHSENKLQAYFVTLPVHGAYLSLHKVFQNAGTLKRKSGTIFISHSGDGDAYTLWDIHVTRRDMVAAVKEISSRLIICVIHCCFFSSEGCKIYLQAS